MNTQTPAQITKDQIVSLCKDSVRPALERCMRAFREMASLTQDGADALAYAETALSAMNKRLAELVGWESGLRQRTYPLEPSARVEYVRAQIAELEGELSRLSGEPLVIYDQHIAHDPPEGGAFLDYFPANAQYGFRHWYPTTEAAKAALLKMAREENCVPSPDGLHVDLSPAGAQYGTTARITRR